MNRSPWLVLALLALLSGCRADPTGADTRHYPCNQQAECAKGFICIMGTCQAPIVPSSDAGDDAGVSDEDAGVPGPTKLSFVTVPQTVTAGQCSQAATVETQTASGSAAPVGSRLTVALSAQAGAKATFYQDAACTSAITSTTVEAGTSRATFYFRGTTAQSVNVVAMVSGFRLAQQNETVRAGAPASVVFVSDPQTLDVGGCSDKVELELRDAYDNPTVFPAQTSLTPLGTDLYFYSDAACTTALIDAPFAAGAARTSFYFRSRPSGTVRLTASMSSLNPVAQNQTLRPLQTSVHTGYCEIPAVSTSVTCTISPAQVDTAKTMLFIQAIGPGNSPDAANVRCWLSSTSAITCSRNNSNTGSLRALIWWKTVEMATGLRVQHLQPTCTNSMTTLTWAIDPVSMGNTFLLVSSEIDGTALDGDDFFTATLLSPTRVKLQFSTPCSLAWKGALQVVEMVGARVTRNPSVMASGNITGGSSSLSPVDLDTSVLLFTQRVSNASTERLCDRVLRGELSSPTSVSFYRSSGNSSPGCTVAAIDEISWERIDFGPVARVQPVTFSFGVGDTSIPMAITSVDTSRTVAFSSAQALDGQGGGEGGYVGDDLNADALVSLNFTTSAELTARRYYSNARAKMTVYVVQFEP